MFEGPGEVGDQEYVLVPIHPKCDRFPRRLCLLGTHRKKANSWYYSLMEFCQGGPVGQGIVWYL